MTKSTAGNISTRKWGSQIAKVQFVELWEGVNSPYRRLANLKPGQSWFDLPEEKKESASQHFVKQLKGDSIPPEAAAAQMLISEGAEEAYVIENWHGIGVMSHDLRGVNKEGCKVWDLIEKYKQHSGRKYGGGFPDVVAYWSDGSVSMCEVKIKNKDDLNNNQKRGVESYVAILGDKLDLRIIEWQGAK